MNNNIKSKLQILLLIFALFCGYKLISCNINVLYSKIANYYYKNNNISMAQEYFERAFEAGSRDSRVRDVYVDLIINSPITTDSQEKLVKIVQKKIYDSANTKAEFFLMDISRDIHRKYFENYIKNAVYNQKVVRWGEMPITYDFINTHRVPQYYLNEFNNALVELEKTTNNLLSFTRNDENPNIIINFVNENLVKDDNLKYVAAYTTPKIVADKLENMEIVFYSRDSRNKQYSHNEVYNIALHEIIHALGFMGHSDNKNDVMYLTKDFKPASYVERKALTEADLNTILLLYKTKPDITNVENTNSEYIPYLVFGTQEDVNNSKIKEAKTYIGRVPYLSSGYMDLAEAYVNSKNYNKALKTFEKALQYAENEDIKAMVYYNLAIVHLYLNELNLAKENVLKSIDINDSEEKHYLLGEIYLKEKDYKSAIKIYSSLLESNPDNIDYAVALINANVVKMNYLQAGKILRTFIKNHPEEKNNAKFKRYRILKMFM